MELASETFLYQIATLQFRRNLLYFRPAPKTNLLHPVGGCVGGLGWCAGRWVSPQYLVGTPHERAFNAQSFELEFMDLPMFSTEAKVCDRSHIGVARRPAKRDAGLNLQDWFGCGRVIRNCHYSRTNSTRSHHVRWKQVTGNHGRLREHVRMCYRTYPWGPHFESMMFEFPVGHGMMPIRG